MLKTIKTVDGYELMTVRNASELCGVALKTVHQWIYDGRLQPRFKAGKTLLVDKHEVITASESYQKTKPRTGGKRKTVKNLEGIAA